MTISLVISIMVNRNFDLILQLYGIFNRSYNKNSRLVKISLVAFTMFYT